jgi:hypothetical protein
MIASTRPFLSCIELLSSVAHNQEHVYAAYGEFLYAWNAIDGPKKGVSITELPNERFNVCDVTTLEQASSYSKTDKAEPCSFYKLKPRIALLLHGTRLAVIISEESITSLSGESKTIYDYDPPISIRVYDISSIPTDGSSLKLLAKSEKPIKASYVDAISNDNFGYLVFRSEINTSKLQLSRDKPQYCGLNSTEYTELAMETASNMTGTFLESLVKELQLLMDGTCANIFMVSSYHHLHACNPCLHSSYTRQCRPILHVMLKNGSYNSKERVSGDTLGSFVQVFRFDMESDLFIDGIDYDVVGTFFPGSPTVYATRDFMALIGEGIIYYSTTTYNPVIKSYILGFNTSHDDRATTIFKPFCFGRISGGATYEFYYPKDRYSADLHESYFRIITTVGNRAKISVLKMPHLLDSEREMLVVGDTSFDLIHSIDADSVVFARFLGDKVYIEMEHGTTHVYDLSNYSDLREVGKLELSGYSEHTYLEPVEIDGVQCMLGIRQTGWESGFEISLVDISDPTVLHEAATYMEEAKFHGSTAV